MKTIAKNKKAFTHYEMMDSFEAGIVLSGSEVKSLRINGASLEDSFAVINRHNEIHILNLHIAEYKQSGIYYNHEPKRTRKLLMHYDQIITLAHRAKKDGLTIIPVSLYLKDSLFKVQICLAKGKKLHDKREDMKKRDAARETKKYR